MKNRIGWIVVGLFLIASSSEAGLFKRRPGKYTPPKAASLLTQGGDETHKLSRGGHRPEKYQRPEWGNIWNQTLKFKAKTPFGHYSEF